MISAMVGEASTTATFLFTDVEGSTRLLKAHRAEYATILADHHRILREQFEAYGGREVDNQGESFFVAFPRARDAVLAAAACQRALADHSWSGGATVRVRMGIHTGEAELSVDRYIGLSVHRAARVGAVGHGGQVLVSPTTAGLLDDEDDLPGVTLRELGTYWLKDIPRPVRLFQLDIEGLPTTFPPLATAEPPGGHRRKRTAVVGALALLAGAIAAAAVVLTQRGNAPPKVLPNSVVRIDPKTLKPTQVVPVGNSPDLVVASGGYVWVTHYILRGGGGTNGLRNAGDRTLTRVDPASGTATVVGGGLAPCGITPDPSGDVWVANCFESTSGQSSTVVRVDARTLAFEATWSVPQSVDYYRGLAYGGGLVWVAGGSENPNSVTQLDPRSGALKTTRLERDAGALLWSEGYGDLWINNFSAGSLTRLHQATGTMHVVDVPAAPGLSAVDRDTIWSSDWFSPKVVRTAAVGSSAPRSVRLPVRNAATGAWNVAAGAGFIWATTPADGSLWRIDPRTNGVTRIPLGFFPAGVTANADDVWVTVRPA